MQYSKISVLFDSGRGAPFFIGAYLRKRIAISLKEVCCIKQKLKLDTCECLYCQFFEHRKNYRDFRIDVKLGSKNYNFDMYLFHGATTKLPYVVLAIYLMLKKRDVKGGKNFKILVNDTDVVFDDSIALPKDYINDFFIKDYLPNIRVELLTPLKLKRNGKILYHDNLNLNDILQSICRKYKGIFGYDICDSSMFCGEIVRKKLYFKKIISKVRSENSEMDFSGIMGFVSIKNLDKDTYKILKIGELLGVGKSCTFGLGKIEIREDNE